jgi:RNA polymerase sigma-70 factor (ECF subfamily)
LFATIRVLNGHLNNCSTVPDDVVIEPGLDVAACVERVRQQDENAARRLVTHLYPLVIKLVRAYLPPRSSEEDLAQTVFMKVFARMDQYSGSVPLEHWVSRIAINTCLNQIAAEKVRPELRWADLSEEQVCVLERVANAGDNSLSDHGFAARELVDQLLIRLEPAERMLITLLHLEGHTPREVAKLTGWNSAVIRARAFQARRKLKNHFEKLMTEKNHEAH